MKKKKKKLKIQPWVDFTSWLKVNKYQFVFILKNNLKVNGIVVALIVYIHLLFHVQNRILYKIEKLQNSQK
jgi:hypothetical protein